MRCSSQHEGWWEQHSAHLLPSCCQLSHLLQHGRLSKGRSVEEQIWSLVCCWCPSEVRLQHEGRHKCSKTSEEHPEWFWGKEQEPHSYWFCAYEFSEFLSVHDKIHVRLCCPERCHSTNHSFSLQPKDADVCALLPLRETQGSESSCFSCCYYY